MEVVKMAIFYPQNKVVLTIFVPVRDVNSVVFLFCFLESFSNQNQVVNTWRQNGERNLVLWVEYGHFHNFHLLHDFV